MNGAESLVRTLVAAGVDVCFTNPGTSEMHFVAALDRVPGMRCVLGLFEGVVTGAADGYYRMTGRPASTLLHLGPGLGNGLANLHNAKRARSGIVNIVGDHATWHVQHDAPLTSDIEGVARPVSRWVKTSPNARSIAGDGALAVQAARRPPGQIATLILPADTAWGEADGPAPALPVPVRPRVASEAVQAAARVLAKNEPTFLVLSDVATRGRSLELAGRIAAQTGCRITVEYGAARLERGAGRVTPERIPYAVDAAIAMFKDTRQMILVGAPIPVAFFAYPGKPSVQIPGDCAVTRLAREDEDLEAALEALADATGARTTPPAQVARLDPPALPAGGALTQEGMAAVLGALMPENAIVCDESVSTGRGFARLTSQTQPHDWLNIMGGAIGWGLPAAVGAAVAAPGRKVIALEGDGSAMYTVQSLWTMARESLDVAVVIFANRSYRILRGELANVGAGEPGQRAKDMLDLDRPFIDWVALARGLGIEARQVTDLEGFAREYRRAMTAKGPYLIEAVI